jgi:putative membrane protein
MTFQLDPYCGAAPVPDALLENWNLDIFLVSALVLVGGCTWPQARASGRIGQWMIFVSLCTVAFISPLCALSSALFSARAVHHIILISFAAPLGWSFFRRQYSIFDHVPPMAAFFVHTMMLWLWHLPVPYTWALSGSLPYWTMEIPLLLSALWVWREILDPQRGSAGALAICAGTILQMTMLGAFLTLAPRPLFSPHFLTADLYGLSPLEDQQLAGLLMWVPASIPYVTAFLFRIGRTISLSSRGLISRSPG